MTIKVKSKVSSGGYLHDVYLYLEGVRINLVYDGNQQYISTDVIEVNDGKLTVAALVTGLNGTGWQINLEIAPEPSNGKSKKYEKKKKITQGGTDVHNEHVDLADLF